MVMLGFQVVLENGIDEVSANKIFDEMSGFAKYAFNKSHAACYAVICISNCLFKNILSGKFMACYVIVFR